MDSFDDEFDRMRKMINKLFNEAFRDFEFAEEPFIYGFTARAGPDGVPKVREFGHRSAPVESDLGIREPLTDVIEGDDEVFVTVELPGVSEENVNLTITPDTLVVEAEGEKQYYHKEIAMPTTVKEEGAKTTFKNGVLDVVLMKGGSPEVNVG